MRAGELCGHQTHMWKRKAIHWLQSREMFVSGMFTDMKGFEIKLELFMKQFREENFMHLPTYNELLMNEEKILS